jgi:hypothetical protein
MKATRTGYYYNMGQIHIPVKSGRIKPKQKIHSNHPDFVGISQYYEQYLTDEMAVPAHLRGQFQDFSNDTVVDKIVDVVIDTAVDLLPDNIEPYVEPFAEPAKEIISDTLESVLNIESPKVEPLVDAKDSDVNDVSKKIKRKKSEN